MIFRIVTSLGYVAFFILQIFVMRHIYTHHPNQLLLLLISLWMLIYTIFVDLMFCAMWGECFDKGGKS